jgi:transposase
VFLIKKTLNHPKADPERRSVFCQEIKKHKEKSRSLVFIDESGFAHDMPRLHGYSAKGSRCFGVHDWGAKGRTNVIGALLSGVLLTITLFQTNVNAAVFNAWVIHDLVPKLPKNSVVIMDNASFHKGQDMVNALENGGHTLLYLPPYSPDLNPIEKKWAHAKAKRRIGGSIEALFHDSYL